MWQEAQTPWLVLYGEPYAHYNLQYRDSLSVPGWHATGITNLHNEQIVITPGLRPQRLLPRPAASTVRPQPAIAAVTRQPDQRSGLLLLAPVAASRQK